MASLALCNYRLTGGQRGRKQKALWITGEQFASTRSFNHKWDILEWRSWDADPTVSFWKFSSFCKQSCFKKHFIYWFFRIVCPTFDSKFHKLILDFNFLICECYLTFLQLEKCIRWRSLKDETRSRSCVTNETDPCASGWRWIQPGLEPFNSESQSEVSCRAVHTRDAWYELCYSRYLKSESLKSCNSEMVICQMCW